MSQQPRVSDQEFVASLRTAVEGFLQAVDRWEAAYRKYYRMPGAATVSDDLETEQREYDERRRELKALLPRARQLCLKHQLGDPVAGLLRVSLGRYSPQERSDSAVGRTERGVVAKCLAELDDACRDWPEDNHPRPSLLRRLVNYFY